MKRLPLVLILALGLGGCAGMMESARKNPSVISASGFFLHLGFDPSPAAGGMPLPNLTLGYGTFVRCGKHDECLIAAGATGEIKSQDTMKSGEPIVSSPGLSGVSSLFVRARNKGIEADDEQSAKDNDRPGKASQ